MWLHISQPILEIVNCIQKGGDIDVSRFPHRALCDHFYWRGVSDTVSMWVFPKIGVPPKSWILIGFSIINHPFWGTPIFGNTHMNIVQQKPCFPWSSFHHAWKESRDGRNMISRTRDCRKKTTRCPTVFVVSSNLVVDLGGRTGGLDFVYMIWCQKCRKLWVELMFEFPLIILNNYDWKGNSKKINAWEGPWLHDYMTIWFYFHKHELFERLFIFIPPQPWERFWFWLAHLKKKHGSTSHIDCKEVGTTGTYLGDTTLDPEVFSSSATQPRPESYFEAFGKFWGRNFGGNEKSRKMKKLNKLIHYFNGQFGMLDDISPIISADKSESMV